MVSISFFPRSHAIINCPKPLQLSSGRTNYFGTLYTDACIIDWLLSFGKHYQGFNSLFFLSVSLIRFRIKLNRRILISIQTIHLILPQRAQLASRGQAETKQRLLQFEIVSKTPKRPKLPIPHDSFNERQQRTKDGSQLQRPHDRDGRRPLVGNLDGDHVFRGSHRQQPPQRATSTATNVQCPPSQND